MKHHESHEACSLTFPILIAAVLLFACITRACPDVSADSIQDARPVQP
jgi:hypothetical protein